MGYDAGGALVGVAIEAKGQGYQDVIRVLYGYSPQDEALTGMKVLQCTDTPGLGDRIREEEFRANFKGLDVCLNAEKDALIHPVETVKHGQKTEAWQIDGISGATISSTAVGTMVNASANRMIPLISRHLDTLRTNN